jgi:hypothetical protein
MYVDLSFMLTSSTLMFIQLTLSSSLMTTLFHPPKAPRTRLPSFGTGAPRAGSTFQPRMETVRCGW